jgi:hypothetical protein
MGKRPAIIAAGVEDAKAGESIFFRKGQESFPRQKSITNRRAEMSFVGNIEEVRSRAQRKIDQGPVIDENAAGNSNQSDDQKGLRLQNVLAKGNLNRIQYLYKYKDEENSVE